MVDTNTPTLHCGKRAKSLTIPLALLLALAITITALPPALAQTPATQTQQYDIPAGSLHDALDALATQADLSIVYSPELVAGKTTAGLSGEFTPLEALRRLLDGSGLAWEEVSESAYLLRSAREQAARAVTEPGSSGRTERDEAVSLEQFVVTGSRLKRTDIEGPAPVIVIDRDQIDRSGFATVRELIGTLPQASVSRDESGIAMFMGPATVQLRGLSLGSTLILINGRRVNASSAQSGSFFDLNSIPLEIVERVEVLTDTASAVYGGDAIGGAVNFILREDYEGAVAKARYGTSYKGDATEKSATVALGGRGDRFNGFVVFEYFDRDPVRGRARNLTSTDDFTRFGGPDRRSLSSFPGNIHALPGSGNLPGLDNPFAGVPTDSTGIGLTPEDFQATDGILNRSDSLAPHVAVIPDTRRAGALFGGRYQLGAQASLFGEMMYSRNERTTELPPQTLTGGEVGLFVVPADNPFNPFGVDVGVNYSFEELGSRRIETEIEFFRALIGAEGTLGAADWEISLLTDRDSSTNFDQGLIDADQVRHFLTATDPEIALNVFSAAPANNPETLEAISTNSLSKTDGEAVMLEATLNGQWDLFDRRPLSYVVGGSYRHESLSRADSERLFDADREAMAAFMEVMLPLLAPAGDRRLELSFASRYDHYDDFGSSFNPQLGLLWRPTRSWLLRASAGTAFKRPTLNDLHAPVTSSGEVVFPDPLRGGELTQFEVRMGGNPDVQPEEATSATIGFIFEPDALPGFSFGANAFRVRHKDFITRAVGFGVMLENPELFGDRIRRAEPTAEDIANNQPGRLLGVDITAINFGEIIVRGIDIQSSYRFSTTNRGSFAWLFNGSYVGSFKVRLAPGDSLTEQVGRASPAGNPVRFKGDTGLAWSGNGGLGANLTARYLHSYVDFDGQRRLPSQWWFDAQISYDFGHRGMAALDGLNARLGVVNLSNNQGHYSNNQLGYDFQQADLRGRFFYLDLSYAF